MAKLPEDRYPTCGALIEAAAAAESEGVDTLAAPGVGDSSANDAKAPTVVIDRGAAPTVMIPEETGAGRGVSIQLIPLRSKGRRSARHRIRVENRTAPAVRVHLEPDGRTRAVPEVAPDALVVAPRSVSWAGVWVRPARARALGRRRLPFRIIANPEGAARVTLDGVMVRPAPVLVWTVIATVILALMGAGAFALTRGREPPGPAGSPPSTPSQAATSDRATCPLTGARAPGGKTPGRPALAVKVDNENNSFVRPQRGLFRADLVFEEPIDGGLTRFVAVFNCSMPDVVGPVRGPRPTDPDLLAELGRPLFAFADDEFATPLAMSGVVDVSNRVNPNGYSRTDVGAPYNLFALPAQLLATRTSTPATRIFTYSRHVWPGSSAGTAVSVPFENLMWRWDPGAHTYLRYYGNEPHKSDGQQLSADNVIVQYVRIAHVTLLGQSVLKAETVGQGRVTVYRNGRMVEGTWSRSSRSQPPVFRDERGRPISMAHGTTWVKLVPAAV